MKEVLDIVLVKFDGSHGGISRVYRAPAYTLNDGDEVLCDLHCNQVVGKVVAHATVIEDSQEHNMIKLIVGVPVKQVIGKALVERFNYEDEEATDE